MRPVVVSGIVFTAFGIIGLLICVAALIIVVIKLRGQARTLAAIGFGLLALSRVVGFVAPLFNGSGHNTASVYSRLLVSNTITWILSTTGIVLLLVALVVAARAASGAGASAAASSYRAVHPGQPMPPSAPGFPQPAAPSAQQPGYPTQPGPSLPPPSQPGVPPTQPGTPPQS